ncbi:hypothetical protein [Butyricicoccus porcorum]|uniref:Uncharacterized protein n=1 Tax=Butyricicoccus porcorum TaxID=1945634 RepID=A0A252F0Z7_9FIRM|nr:hypothetical protein [Butyricicoccus porcorum]MCI6927287.1 hypothetical protein [Butyricicoccus porcorum]MDD6986574.1 hypothetical protein [Butyricicoccus porcorum]MDY4484063.1 hypothetical protein [Butyricicoccus porcorum]OUM19484.1 hypothetical protein CBW42_13060 [Butyricicoccus porcorum]
MKTLMILFLIGFLVFGAIGMYFRLTHDWNQLAVESDKLSDDSIAKRDGRAMQLFNHGEKHAVDVAAAKQKADRKFHHQLLFSVLSVVCLVGAIVCGAVMQ